MHEDRLSKQKRRMVYAINTTIMKTLEYPMMATMLTESDWEYILVPLLAAGLPRAGLTRTFPRDILFGPTLAQGFGVFHPWYHQQITYLTTLLQHTQQQTMTGQLITASYEQLRLEMGTSGFMMDVSYQTMKDTVTKTWLTNLWEFADKFQIKIQDDTSQLKPQRQNDKFIMDALLAAGFKGYVLKELNACQMFLNTVALADIVNADGLDITINTWNGLPEDRGESQYQWPRQPNILPEKQWKQWRKVITKVFLAGHSRRLKEPLLLWEANAPSHWKWFYCLDENRLYAKEGILWRAYRQHRIRTSPRQGRAKYSKTDMVLRTPPNGLRFATIIKHGQLIHHQGPGHIIPIKSSRRKCTLTSFEQARKARNYLDQWAIQETSLTDDGEAIAKAISKGTAIAVSDGSYKDGRGTAGFILETSENFESKNRIVGVNSIPGEQEDQSSYRSEIGGVSGVVETVGILCNRFAIKSGDIKVGLDGEQAMQNIFGNWPLYPGQADYDLLKDLREKIKKSPITWTGIWVEGHQDEDTSFEDLDQWSQLNVESDGLSKDYWNSCMENEEWMPNKGFADEGWSIWIEDKKVTKVDKQALYAYAFSNRTTKYWATKHHLTSELITDINWEACQKSLNQLPFRERRWLLKHATGFCGVGKMELLRGDKDHQECPRCGQAEDAPHVVRCKGTGTDVVFEVAVQQLEIHMGEKQTAPEIIAGLGKRIRQWRKYSTAQIIDQDTPFPRYYRNDELGTKATLSEQDRIGWYNLLLGRMSKKWMDAQQKYLESMGKCTTGRRWMISIISKLWDIAWDMWQHRNHIVHNTLHPQKRLELELEKIGAQINELYAQGNETLLQRDKTLFLKSLETIKKGNCNEQAQWVTSVILAKQRAAAAKSARKESMTTERTLMEAWLGLPQTEEEAKE
jgi:hypothetical protein